MKVIGLVGRLKSGKDTFYQCVQAASRADTGVCKVHRLAFADALKEEVAQACGVSLADINEQKDVYRPMLQWWGTEFRRRLYHEEYWIHRLHEKLTELRYRTPPPVAVFITDVRFPNEGDYVRRQGGQLVRIVRPQTESNGAVAGHASEASMDAYPVDGTILNDGCLGALEEVARQFWEKLQH